MRTHFFWMMVVMSLFAGSLTAQERGYTPEGKTYLQQQIKKAQTAFVDTVTEISQLDKKTVWEWMPKEGQKADPNFKIIVAIEKKLGKPLSSDQRNAIIQADNLKKETIQKAREVAKQK